MTEHQRIERDGSVILVVRDEDHGAVTLEAWADRDGDPHGILVLHYPHPLPSALGHGQCEFLPGGQCYQDMSFAAGRELAPDVLAGYDSRALVELYQWFADRMTPGEETP